MGILKKLFGRKSKPKKKKVVRGRPAVLKARAAARAQFESLVKKKIDWSKAEKVADAAHEAQGGRPAGKLVWFQLSSKTDDSHALGQLMGLKRNMAAVAGKPGFRRKFSFEMSPAGAAKAAKDEAVFETQHRRNLKELRRVEAMEAAF